MAAEGASTSKGLPLQSLISSLFLLWCPVQNQKFSEGHSDLYTEENQYVDLLHTQTYNVTFYLCLNYIKCGAVIHCSVKKWKIVAGI